MIAWEKDSKNPIFNILHNIEMSFFNFELKYSSSSVDYVI